MTSRWTIALWLVLALAAAPMTAPAAGAQEAGVGPVTNLPLPRFVSLKAAEARARRGPSTSHRIDWVYQRRGMPLQVVAEHGHWRRVQDVDGMGGWVHYALLTGTRHAMVIRDLTTVRARPHAKGRERAHLEAGVIARLDECEAGWCRIEVGKVEGWVAAAALWGD